MGYIQNENWLISLPYKDIINLNEKMPPWRNRLARSAVNRKVGGSNPPGGVIFSFMRVLSILTPQI